MKAAPGRLGRFSTRNAGGATVTLTSTFTCADADGAGSVTPTAKTKASDDSSDDVRMNPLLQRDVEAVSPQPKTRPYQQT